MVIRAEMSAWKLFMILPRQTVLSVLRNIGLEVPMNRV